MDKKVILKYNINTKDYDIEFIKQKIFERLMKSALNTSGYQIIRSKNYSKPFVPLRIQKKLESMNSNQKNMLDPFANK